MIHFSNITKTYGKQVLFKDASFMIRPGDKIGLVGPNGAGKTTIFRILTKEEGFDSGNISVPEKLKIAYFSQSVGEMKGRTVLAEAMEGHARLAFLLGEMKKIEKRFEDSAAPVPVPIADDEMDALLNKMGDYQTEFEQLGGHEWEAKAQETLSGLGFHEEDFNRPVENFSGGWKMRIALAKILLMDPYALLMDEPTNYLDLESIVWLEKWLKEFKGPVLMTSHDRDFLNGIVNTIVEVTHQSVTTYSGNYDFYLREKDIRRDQQQASFDRQKDMLKKEEEFIARFAARASHAAQVQSRVKKLDKIERIETPPEEKTINFTFPVPPRSGQDVVRMENLGKTYELENGNLRPVFKNVTAQVNRLQKIAVVGVNGAGKSTLLKVICGLTPATEGTVTLGSSLKVGYFSQYSLDVLRREMTVLEEMNDRLKNTTSDGFIRNLLAAFLFRGDDVHKKISVLSGGEKSRLIIATLLATNCNLLVLDEPTNHLDIRSREVLLDALKGFEGTVLMVSHDRHFLRSLANQVFEVGKGGVNVINGDYDYYLSKISLGSS